MDMEDNRPSPPRFAVAGSLLEALAETDFERLTTVLDRQASLSALSPDGFVEWRGAAKIAAVFRRWFGEDPQAELVDAALGQVGPRLQMRWQLRFCGPGSGRPPGIVEQYAYADSGPSGRIQSMWLLCSGLGSEHFDV
jgi:hypothetical protein